MLNVENRTPYPGKEGRVRIRQDNGQVIEGILEMADDASVGGTPWSRQTGRLLQADIRAYPVKAGYEVKAGDIVNVSGNTIISRRTALSNIDVGASVMINEEGEPVEYIVIQKGVPSGIYDSSCDGVWLLRKDIANSQEFQPDRNNVYETSSVYEWLTSTMLKKYDQNLEIKQVKIPYLSGGGLNGELKTGSNGLSCKIFLLSGYELGWTKSDSSYFPADGAVLEYFNGLQTSDKKRTALFNGSPYDWFIRSPKLTEPESVFYVNKSGGYSTLTFADGIGGVRPVIVLPYDIMVLSNNISTEQAIALNDGFAGDDVEIVYSGEVYADWTKEGQKIIGNGVRGYGAADGLLSVFPHWFSGQSVTIGNGITPTEEDKIVEVDLGFRPALIGVRNYTGEWDFSVDTLKVYIGGSSSSYAAVFEITDNGFTIYAEESDGTGKGYDYLAFR